MSVINAVLRSLFDAILYPLHQLPAIVGVALVSLLTAVGMLLVFRYASDQKRMSDVKRRIHACVFEIRLFNDDLRAIVRAQLEILRHNWSYLKLTLRPMLWMIVPILLLIAQLQFHYGYSGLEPGKSAVLTARLDPERETIGNGDEKPAVRLVAPAGLRVETPAVWVSSLNEISWRVGAERPGEYELEVEMNGASYTKSVLVSAVTARRSPIRLEPGFFNQLLYPAEDPLPSPSPFQSIELGYPDHEVDLFGLRLHWLIVFFVLSIVFAFSLKGLFGVTI
jgi:uncharacterized membrane protein (DUF106 family)